MRKGFDIVLNRARNFIKRVGTRVTGIVTSAVIAGFSLISAIYLYFQNSSSQGNTTLQPETQNLTLAGNSPELPAHDINIPPSSSINTPNLNLNIQSSAHRRFKKIFQLQKTPSAIIPNLERKKRKAKPTTHVHHLNSILSKHYQSNLDQNDGVLALLRPLFKQNDLPAGSSWVSNFIVTEYLRKLLIDWQGYPYRLVEIDILAERSVNNFIERARLNKFTKSVGVTPYNECTKIIWPILIDRHFHLVTIFRPNNESVYIDCMDGFNSTNTNTFILQKARSLAMALFPGATITTANLLILLQGNSVDCGVVVCSLAKEFITKNGFSYSEPFLQRQEGEIYQFYHNYSPFRYEMAQKLAEREDMVHLSRKHRP